ncbi:MAG TPA: efflux RND transporter permease subunit [Mycobacteriales bacterium]|nr:efflux RND transporter permease subunit [Mycobacteriales bacterium]
MMRWIVGSSLRSARLVVAAAVALLAVGIIQLRHAPVDAYPEFVPPTVQIQTEALGLSAAEVEQLITVPLEQDLLNGVPWLDKITSESRTGLSSIDLVFEAGTNVLRARQMVQERLSQAHALPAVGSPPIMIQPLSSTSRVMMIGLSSKELSLIDMSVLARWKIRPKLMGIPGVASVAIWGQRDRQLQVQVDPDRLRQYGISLNQVIDTAGNALWVSPLTFVEASTPGTGGFIDTASQRFGVQHILPITSPAQLASVTVEDSGGRRLRLGDVAHVVEDHQPLIGDAVLDGAPSLMLVIQKFPEANTLAVTKAVEEAMAALTPGLSGVQIDTTVYRPASFLETALHNLGIRGLIGLVLVGALLLAFFSWRVALISFVTIPLALVAAAYVLYLRGAPFNMMILAGLAAALGAVVDDAVVGVDVVRRRLRERRGSDDGRSTSAVIVEALLEVRGPLMYATLVVLIAALPVAVLGGVAGSFTRPLVVAYCLAVLASMLVALTVTPALAHLLLAGARPERRPSPMARWTERTFDRVAARFVGRPGRAYAVVAVLVLAGLAVIPQLDRRSLIPAPRDQDVLIQVQAAAGTSLQEMDRITTTASRELRALPGVRDVGVHVGRAIISDRPVNVNSAEVWVSMAGSADHGSTLAAIQRVVNGYPGLRNQVLTYQEDRLAAARTGPAQPLVVRVYGPDLQVLRTEAETVRRELAAVSGVVRPVVETPAVEPTLQIEVNLATAEKYGIKPGDVRRSTATLLSGLLVGNLYDEQKIFDVVVWGTSPTRHSLTSVQNLLIDTPSGGHVRLRDVASVRIGPYPTVIRHDAVSRSLDVTAGVSGRQLGAVVADVKSRLGALTYPLEYRAEVVSATGEQGSGPLVLGFALAAVVGIVLLLQAASRSWRVAALLLVTLPLAGVGGVLAGSLAGGIMSAGALTGFLVVLAVTVRHGLLLVRGYQRLAESEAVDGTELVRRGTRERVAPIMLTALATAAAVLPFAVSGGVAGTEILHPLAVVVLGGLVTSTLVTLFVLPALYLRFGSSQRPAPPGSTFTPAVPRVS